MGTGCADYRVAEYCGATTVARFGDPQAELAALDAGCGVYDLGFRAKIALTGSDRVRWLNGMVTNNIRDLATGSGVYAFLLNPQGHILGDLYAYNRGEEIVIDTDCSQVEKILATFDHYIIMDDVEVTRLDSPDGGVRGYTTLGVAGPRAKEVLQAAGIEVPDAKPLEIFEATCTCDCECTKCTAVHSEDASYELWLNPGDVRETWDALVAKGATPVGFEALELRRILAGIPRYGIDIREKDLPQETEQVVRALNFSKGCYVGQEIVERIRSRGAVHRKFTGFVVQGEAAIGSKIRAGDKEVGEITSSASVSIFGGVKTVALGYIRREAGTPGREVVIGETLAKVAQMPLTVESFSRGGGLVQQPA